MSAPEDRDFSRWTAEWQSAPAHDETTVEEIRRYVQRRTGLLWSFAVADFVIAGITLPVLLYLAWVTEEDVERLAMLGLASIVVAAVCFGWWNWRGVLRSSATSVAEYVAISTERLRRIRLAWRIGWVVLVAQVIVFTIWIWDHLYSGAQPMSPAAARFAWGWLGGFTAAAIIGLIAMGRWISRDAERFERLRRELE